MVTYRAADCQVHDAPYVPRYQATSGDRCPGHGRCSRPSSLLIATIGCYALRILVVDVWVMFIAGIVGYFLRRSGYSMAGIVLGVILDHIGESAFVKSAQLFQYDLTLFYTRPICAVLITLAVVSPGVSIWRALRRDLAGVRAG